MTTEDLTYYKREVVKPKTMKEGLSNFIQMIVNSAADGDCRNAVLTGVDLLQDLQSGIYDDAITKAVTTEEILKLHTPALQPEGASKGAAAVLVTIKKEAFEEGRKAGCQEGFVKGRDKMADGLRRAIDRETSFTHTV